MKSRVVVAGSALLAAGALVGTSAPAHAAGNAVYTAHISGATATFHSYGEVLRIKDTKANGHSAVVQLSINGSFYEMWEHHGSGHTAKWNLSIPEGSSGYMRACNGEWKSGKLVNCTGWHHVSA